MLASRYASEARATEILNAIEADEQLSFEHRIQAGDVETVLAVTARRVRDPVTGAVVAQITEEDITRQANLAASLEKLNAELEHRVRKRAQELSELNTRLRDEIAEREKAAA